MTVDKQRVWRGGDAEHLKECYLGIKETLKSMDSIAGKGPGGGGTLDPEHYNNYLQALRSVREDWSAMTGRCIDKEPFANGK